MDASDLAHGGVISLRTIVHAQMAEIARVTISSTEGKHVRRMRAMSDLLETYRRRREEIRELRAADRTRQQQIIQTLTGTGDDISGQSVKFYGLLPASRRYRSFALISYPV
ncbi:hypothetical protein Tco_1406021 [Tanacetum coccineum]